MTVHIDSLYVCDGSALAVLRMVEKRLYDASDRPFKVDEVRDIAHRMGLALEQFEEISDAPAPVTLEQLLVKQMELYPTSIIVTGEQLIEMHTRQELRDTYDHRYTIESINRVLMAGTPAVFYVLPPGIDGWHNADCCNGIRYGMEDSEYMSHIGLHIDTIKEVMK